MTQEQANVIRKREIALLAKERAEEKAQKEIRLKVEDLTPIKQNYINLSPHLKQAEVVYSMRHAVDAICRLVRYFKFFEITNFLKLLKYDIP